MDWIELGFFTENLAKMLNDGISLEKALAVASQGLKKRSTHRLAQGLHKIFLQGHDVQKTLVPFNLPPLVLTLLEYGRSTGHLPEALYSASYFFTQLGPLKRCLQNCRLFTSAALLVSFLVKLIFVHRPDFTILSIFIIIFILPYSSKVLRDCYDSLLANVPFLQTLSQQLTLMEFFICMEIVYDSTLPVTEMFKNSISAISNSYLRKQANLSLAVLSRGQSFAAALKQIPFVPKGIVAYVHTNEESGTLDKCFHDVASHFKKIAEAKLEIVKYLSVAVIINASLLLPVLLIVPLFLPENLVTIFLLGIGILMGYVPFMCLRAALANYRRKALVITQSFDFFDDKNLDL